MSTPAHFNSEIILQTVRAQSSRVPTPLPDDPYVAIRQAHLVDMDTESGPVKDLRETEVPQPLVVVPSLIPSSDVLHLTVGQAHTPAIVGTEFEPEEAPSETEEFKASEPSDTRITSSHSSASSDSTAPLSPDHLLTQTSPTPTPTRVSFTAANHVVALTPGSAITIPETANEFAIKDAWLRMKEMLLNCHGHNMSKGNIIKIFYHGLSEITQEVLNATVGGIFLYKTPNQAYQLFEDKVLLKLDWAKNQKIKPSLKKNVAFADGGSINSDTNKIMARMDAMTLKMDAQYKELQSNAKKQNPILMKMTSLCPVKKNQNSCKFFNLETKFDRLADKQYGQPSGSLPSNTQPNPKGHNSKAYQPPQSRNEHVNVVFTRSGKSYNPPVNPNEEHNKTKDPINFDSDDEDDEPTP
ncbi:hypothetical protein Tco_0923221 [Tanacetum coccineum]|uniref:Reverse transcriptase domain-containing protein n=1 Tax=Tanacetum coccineum TaxID=301880 RepID=A0ABQ5D1N3_9ASTR